jgi:hypothetical protein
MSRHSVVFLLGVPRSGTTLLSVLLNQHPEILCPPEPWLMLAFSALGTTPASNPARATDLRQATNEFLGSSKAELLGRCTHLIYSHFLDLYGKSVFVDKTPRSYFCLDFIQEAMPDARYVWIRRNPLDSAASYKDSWDLGPIVLFEKLINDPNLFDLTYGLNALVNFSQSHDVCTVKYESLVSNPQSEVSRIFDHLALRPVALDHRLQPYLEGHLHSSFGDTKIRRTDSVHRSGVGRYRHILTERETLAVLSALGRPLFAKLGYEQEFDEAAGRLGANIPDRSQEVNDLVAKMLLERRRFTEVEYEEHASTRRAVSMLEALMEGHRERGTLIGKLTDQLRDIDADRRAKDEVIARLSAEIEAIDGELKKLIEERAAAMSRGIFGQVVSKILSRKRSQQD